MCVCYVLQAEADAQRLNAAFEALAEAALASNDSASTDLDTTTAAGAAGAEVAAEGAAGDGTRPSESRQELLLRAEAAEQVTWLGGWRGHKVDEMTACAGGGGGAYALSCLLDAYGAAVICFNCLLHSSLCAWLASPPKVPSVT